MTQPISFVVNGRPVSVRIDDPEMPLLYALRNDCGLHAPRFGCGLGQCGACTVHIDGKAVRSCVIPVSTVAGRNVKTLEGLSAAGTLHPLQQAFIDEQAMQCGYCMNGMIMQAAALLEQHEHPSDAQIRSALARNLCRCGSHLRVIRAIHRAASMTG